MGTILPFVKAAATDTDLPDPSLAAAPDDEVSDGERWAPVLVALGATP